MTDLVVESEHAVVAEMRNRLSAGDWVLREWQIRRKDGSTFTCQVSAKQLPDGSFHAIWRDVSAGHERDEVLRHSEERFRALTATSVASCSARK